MSGQRLLGWENSPAGGATTPKRITCFRVFYDDDDEPCEFVEVAPIGTLSVTVADRVLNEMRPNAAVTFVSQLAPRVPNETEPNCEYIVQTSELSLWRSFCGTAEQEAADSVGEFQFQAYGLGRSGSFNPIIKRAAER